MDKKKELSPWEKTCTQRIRKLIDDHCDGNQKIFADKTGLNRGSVSQYVNGKNVPSISNAEKIASAFGVESAWILGSDILPPGVDEEHDPHELSEAIALYERIQRLPQDKQNALQNYLRFLQSDS